MRDYKDIKKTMNYSMRDNLDSGKDDDKKSTTGDTEILARYVH